MSKRSTSRLLVHFRQHDSKLMRLFGTSSPTTLPQPNSFTRNIAVVGGGLAGLSVAHHLLENNPQVHITILDVAPVGKGGASSVAGGLLHPLSPRGDKLVHWGLEGLQHTHHLIEYSLQHQPNCIASRGIYRIATTRQQVQDLQQQASLLKFCSWKSSSEIQKETQIPNSLGGLFLTGPCQVLDVSSYLEGLWMSCLNLSNHSADWVVLDQDKSTKSLDDYWNPLLRDHDAVVLAAGAGMFDAPSNQNVSCLLKNPSSWPIQLVQGQSLELKLHIKNPLRHGILCGKYITPTLEPNKVTVGATHEFNLEKKWRLDLVEQELKNRTAHASPSWLWQETTIKKITDGCRVQTNRGALGRIPMVGKLLEKNTNLNHDNVWVFTGLSSRGLLHHGIYGKWLAHAILQDTAEVSEEYAHLNWWRKKLRQK